MLPLTFKFLVLLATMQMTTAQDTTTTIATTTDVPILTPPVGHPSTTTSFSCTNDCIPDTIAPNSTITISGPDNTTAILTTTSLSNITSTSTTPTFTSPTSLSTSGSATAAAATTGPAPNGAGKFEISSLGVMIMLGGAGLLY
ncbi:hypothetical protein DL96DRAFT_596930 [Flagelloscypha sp. PMI_526]|nr:hypothetical protein DL96DRAFT_596930 [Flagelloscypha sp. PMI_526]